MAIAFSTALQRAAQMRDGLATRKLRTVARNAWPQMFMNVYEPREHKITSQVCSDPELSLTSYSCSSSSVDSTWFARVRERERFVGANAA